MKKYLTLLFLAFQWFMSSQVENFNPKKNLYFGANIGLNNFNIHSNDSKKSFQGGVFAEYYFAKQWSLLMNLSYFETGLDYYFSSGYGSRGFGGSSSLSPHTYSANFSGEVLATSLHVKWEFRLIKNFKGYLKTGFGYYIETQSSYENYIGDKNKANYPSTYGGWISGMGFTYFINDKYALLIESEVHQGAVKFRGNNNFYGSGERYASNQLVSLGFKYNFKNSKNENTN